MNVERREVPDPVPPPPRTARERLGPAAGDLSAWFVSHDPLPVVALRDPAVEASGHHPASAYVEHFWLPVLGPRATWAQRRLVSAFEQHGGSCRLPLIDLARELGLGVGAGRHSAVVRTLCRLVSFGLARPVEEVLAVRLVVPALPARYLTRLPDHLAKRHHEDRLASCAGGGRTEPSVAPGILGSRSDRGREADPGMRW